MKYTTLLTFQSYISQKLGGKILQNFEKHSSMYCFTIFRNMSDLWTLHTYFKLLYKTSNLAAFERRNYSIKVREIFPITFRKCLYRLLGRVFQWIFPLTLCPGICYHDECIVQMLFAKLITKQNGIEIMVLKFRFYIFFLVQPSLLLNRIIDSGQVPIDLGAIKKLSGQVKWRENAIAFSRCVAMVRIQDYQISISPNKIHYILIKNEHKKKITIPSIF